MFIITTSFIVFLIINLAVGLLSSKSASSNTEDYFLASRSVNPIFIGLSTASTCLSGYMFTGFIGYTYIAGIKAVWFMITWILGDMTNWLLTYSHIRKNSEAVAAKTLASLVSNFIDGRKYRYLLLVVGFLTILLMGTYAAAQLQAVAKVTNYVLHWDSTWVIIATAIMIIIYSVAGGIRASIWTDVIQSFFMIFAMSFLCISLLNECGGFSALFNTLSQQDSKLAQILPPMPFWYLLIYFTSLIVNGLIVIGQPHVVARVMSLDDEKNIGTARNTYLCWYFIFASAAYIVGLTARALMPELGSIDPEISLPMLSNLYLPKIMIGIMLSGVFSAALSTADSQVLSCSSSLTQDLFTKYKNSYKFTKIGTILVTIGITFIALYGTKSVFGLSTLSWSCLGCSAGPLILLKILKLYYSEKTAIIMVLSSLMVVVVSSLDILLGTNIDFGVHPTLYGLITAATVYFISYLSGSTSRYKTLKT